MKLTWKIFFSTLFLTILTFGVGGYLLISAQFRSALSRELIFSGDESKLLAYSAQSVVEAFPRESHRTLPNMLRGTLSGSSGFLQVRVLGDGVTYYETQGMSAADPGTLPDPGTLVQSVRQEGECYHIVSICAVEAGRQRVTVETHRDITALFTDRQSYVVLFQRLLLGVTFLGGIAIYLLSRWIVRPLGQLSAATREMAQGNYRRRVPIRGEDELARLSADYNAMAEHLESTVAQLEEEIRRRQTFIASFAHEVKTPLTSIIGYAELLEGGRLEAGDRDTAIAYIRSEGLRLETLSHKLLELLLLQWEEFALQPVRVSHLFAEIKHICYPMLADLPIQLETELEQDATVLIEPDLMKTLLQNLVDNARKAIDGPGTIALCCRVEDGSCTLSVWDTGKGIPEGDLSRITEAFYTADRSRSRQSGGAGMGLAICAEIAAIHGTQLSIVSKVGKGTTVSIQLKGEIAGETA